jgi:hypothetical protein
MDAKLKNVFARKFFVNLIDILSWKVSQGTEGNYRKPEFY